MSKQRALELCDRADLTPGPERAVLLTEAIRELAGDPEFANQWKPTVNDTTPWETLRQMCIELEHPEDPLGALKTLRELIKRLKNARSELEPLPKT